MSDDSIKQQIDDLYGALLVERLANAELRATNRELRLELTERLSNQTSVVRSVLQGLLQPRLGSVVS